MNLKMELKSQPILLVLLCLNIAGCVCWDADAGLVQSMTKMSGVSVQASSSSSSADRVVDGNDNTNWVSSYCLPNGYSDNPETNLLYGLCAGGSCTSSNGGNMTGATDGSFYTVAHIHGQPSTGTPVQFALRLPTARLLTMLTMDGIFHDDNVHLAVIDDNNVKHALRTFTTGDSYKSIQVSPININVTSIEIESQFNFDIKELYGMGTGGCVERITVDLGSVKTVGIIRTRHWTGADSAKALYLQTSIDGTTWHTQKTLDSTALRPIETSFTPEAVRYISLEYHVKPKSYNKVYCYEIDAWDEYGQYGPPLSVVPQRKTIREILGINGIWGWGHSKYSNSLTAGQGPTLYNSVSSLARNYHNLDWDVSDPDNDPGYANMAAGHGTQGKWWLNWDTEYTAWNNANLLVDTSIQFTNKSFPQSKWDHPEQSAYNYGREFAKHFGNVTGNGLVYSMEVGNEPWDYQASFYATVLKGMTAGVKSVDSMMQVLPGAFQADDIFDTGNYIGTHVLQNSASNIDVINGHFYSFVNSDTGIRQGTYPENKLSSFNGVRNLYRWRDTNMPGKPIWVTEWGWDSDGAGEHCGFSECVTEQAQAVYGVRGLMILARSDVERTAWYFYANTECNHLFCRSGLTTTKDHSFSKKTSFFMFQELLSLIGNKYFLGVLQENDMGFIYCFGDEQQPHAFTNQTALLQKTTHIVAWLPTDISNTTKQQVLHELPSGVRPGQGHILTGKSHSQYVEKLPVINMVGNSLVLELYTFPIIISLERYPTGIVVGK